MSPQEHPTLETFSGIPLRSLLQNDAKVTELDLRRSGCGVFEAVLLAAVLKVLRVCATCVCAWGKRTTDTERLSAVSFVG